VPVNPDVFTTLAYGAAAILAVAVALAVAIFFAARWGLTRASNRLAAHLTAFAASRASQGTTRAAWLARLDRLAYLMDDAVKVPIIGGVGLDALLGLVPVAGDAASAVVGIGLVSRAVRLGVPREILAKMIANVCIDLALGAVPVVGDLADILFRSNARNIKLLKDFMDRSG
jgi:hypothetical protein